ncbi:hypothetical protein, conserved [Angomonas deanei]|uniref:Uncharacterized protein n=1 Tax=Angomonas deanei TaxID=59799 RepID=A0A7G2CF32_9TRYP|nr:hypothetical protein, conserved [Angomonas deanei]
MSDSEKNSYPQEDPYHEIGDTPKEEEAQPQDDPYHEIGDTPKEEEAPAAEPQEDPYHEIGDTPKEEEAPAAEPQEDPYHEIGDTPKEEEAQVRAVAQEETPKESSQPKASSATRVVKKLPPGASSAGSRTTSVRERSPREEVAEAPRSAAAASQGESELESLQRQLAEVEKEEATLDQRLQLYSEVTSLKRELEVVQSDEARLRNQLATVGEAKYDPEVAKEVALLEDEAQQSSLHALWEEVSKEECEEVDITNQKQRVEAARKKIQESNAKAEELYAQQEEKINEHTDNRERTKASLKESYDEEMANLKEARQRLKQVESEQAYHYKRGTTRRQNRAPVGSEKLAVSRQRRIDDAEARTTQQVDKMNDELAELMEQCKVLKKQLDDTKKQASLKQEEQDVALKGVVDEGTEAKEFREKLEKEQQDLTALKADLQGVLHYVRAKKREEDDF